MKQTNKKIVFCTCALSFAILILTILSFVDIIKYSITTIISFVLMSAFYGIMAAIFAKNQNTNKKYINFLIATSFVCFILSVICVVIFFAL